MANSSGDLSYGREPEEQGKETEAVSSQEWLQLWQEAKEAEE